MRVSGGGIWEGGRGRGGERGVREWVGMPGDLYDQVAKPFIHTAKHVHTPGHSVPFYSPPPPLHLSISPLPPPPCVHQIPERAGPGPNDGSSILWLYHSHRDEARDTWAGLGGPLIITRKGTPLRADGSPADVDVERVLFFAVMDESQSLYSEVNIIKWVWAAGRAGVGAWWCGGGCGRAGVGAWWCGGANVNAKGVYQDPHFPGRLHTSPHFPTLHTFHTSGTSGRTPMPPHCWRTPTSRPARCTARSMASCTATCRASRLSPTAACACTLCRWGT